MNGICGHWMPYWSSNQNAVGEGARIGGESPVTVMSSQLGVDIQLLLQKGQVQRLVWRLVRYHQLLIKGEKNRAGTSGNNNILVQFVSDLAWLPFA